MNEESPSLTATIRRGFDEFPGHALGVAHGAALAAIHYGASEQDLNDLLALVDEAFDRDTNHTNEVQHGTKISKSPL